MSLTSQQIDELAAGDKVRRVAVENFLSSLDGLTSFDAVQNLHTDARLYRWNAETERAIKRGIHLNFSRRA